MTASKIEWTGFTWNPIVGCSVCSPGCKHCYAMKMARRIELMGTAPHYAGLTQMTKAGPVWTGKLVQAPDDTLFEPLRRKKPTTWFVNSMSDLFHESVPDDWIDRIFAVMALCPQHTFQVLTKRSARMREYLSKTDVVAGICAALDAIDEGLPAREHWEKPNPLEDAFSVGYNLKNGHANPPWPLPNVWLGVSCEDQKNADARIPDLLATPAAVRFISAEPLLGPIDLDHWLWGRASRCDDCASYGDDCPCDLQSRKLNGEPSLDWVIIGGESGPRARDFRLSWAKSLIEQCRAADVPAFMKQVGSNAWDDISYVGSAPAFKTRDRKGGDLNEWPTCLQIREMPT
jgi:protein gp37